MPLMCYDYIYKYFYKKITINVLTLIGISVNILIDKHVEFCIIKKGEIA